VHADYRRAGQLDETFREYGISLAALNTAYFMDENELRILAQSPLASIGAHTTSHAALCLPTPEAIHEEFADNRRYLENLLDRRVLGLAPSGVGRACGEREFALAADCGFRSAVAARYGPVFAAHRYRPHVLPRIAAGGTGSFDGFAEAIGALREAEQNQFPMSLQ
jgi:peptidoglycan/xylan/chitin deacetylase (PgdA/CDA1 family)